MYCSISGGCDDIDSGLRTDLVLFPVTLQDKIQLQGNKQSMFRKFHGICATPNTVSLAFLLFHMLRRSRAQQDPSTFFSSIQRKIAKGCGGQSESKQLPASDERSIRITTSHCRRSLERQRQLMLALLLFVSQ